MYKEIYRLKMPILEHWVMYVNYTSIEKREKYIC